MAQTEQGGAGDFFRRLLDRASDVALQGASRWIDAEIAQHTGLVEADLSPGVDQGQQRVTDVSRPTIDFGGSPLAWGLFAAGVVVIYLAVK